MHWFRKSLLWMSVVGSFSSAAAQESAWKPAATPRSIALGRPAPLSAGPSSPTAELRVIAETPHAAPDGDGVRLTSYTAPRTVRGVPADEPKTLYLPREVPPLPARVAPPRWPYRTTAASQPEPGNPGDAPGQNFKVFVAPFPQPVQQPLQQPAPEPAPLPGAPAPAPATPTFDSNPWTGAPMPGATMEGQLFDQSGVLPPEDWDGSNLSPVVGQRFYARAEYLLWWIKGFYLPPLVETGPATVNESIRGAPGAPGTALLFGNSNTSSGPVSGARFTAGWWFDPCGLWGIEASGFFLGRQSDHFHTDSTQNPVIARPFFNVNTGKFDRQLTATPGLLPTDAFKLRGALDIDTHSQLWGAEVNLRRMLCCGCNYNLSALAGFRYLNLSEGITIQESITSAMAVQGTNLLNPGNMITVFDSFQTQNQFYGGQVGLQGEVRRGPWSLWTSVKLGLGNTHQTINIAGNQTVDFLGGGRQTFNGGLLALPSNSGSFSRDQVSFVPQIGFNVGYFVTPNLRLFVGYDFLYWSNVVRPGDQIDLALNSNQIPNFNIPPAVAPPSNLVRPIVPFRSTGFWAQGVNAGLEFRY